MPVGMERESGHLHGASLTSVNVKGRAMFDCRVAASYPKVEEGGRCMDRGLVRSKRQDGLAACDVLHDQSRSSRRHPPSLRNWDVDVDDAQSPALCVAKMSQYRHRAPSVPFASLLRPY